MFTIPIQIVDSITQEVDEIQSTIRLRAFEKYMSRGHAAHRQLEDWLAAETEVMLSLTPTVAEEGGEIIAHLIVPPVDPQNIRILMTSRSAMIEVAAQHEQRPGFGVLHFPEAIRPDTARAVYSQDLLRITASIADTSKSLQQSA
jgi:hypothetical protein